MGYLRHQESLSATGGGAKCAPERRPRRLAKRLQFDDDADVGVAAFDAQEELRNELERFIGRYEIYDAEDREEYWKPAGMKMQYVKGNLNSYH
ncbi:unnamed protein product [Phyllotreta striolata]|uniref:Uncharacterized protein n=1 Tax=Phyllotreta striolata TaxID=444603 RepID=A0A9N9XRJ1_PHYSR|nr:unnamed protein product [Phyllotreta striolata]